MSIVFLFFFITFFVNCRTISKFGCMDGEFLHAIDVQKLLREVGLDITALAQLIGVEVQSIYRWSWSKGKKGNRPKFNAIVKMLEKCATVETLFGVDYAIKSTPTDLSIKLSDDDIARAFIRAGEMLKNKEGEK